MTDTPRVSQTLSSPKSCSIHCIKLSAPAPSVPPPPHRLPSAAACISDHAKIPYHIPPVSAQHVYLHSTLSQLLDVILNYYLLLK